MNDVQQLGEMLRHYAQSEAHKKQVFETQSAQWAVRIGQLFDQIEQCLGFAGELRHAALAWHGATDFALAGRP